MSRHYLASQFSSHSTATQSPDQKYLSLKREIDSLKSMFIEKTDQLIQLESLFSRALEELNYQVDSLEERRNRFSMLEMRLAEKVGQGQAQRGVFPKQPRRKSPGDFSFSHHEGEDTSHFSFGEIDENIEVRVPYNYCGQDSLEFEEFLNKNEGSALSSVKSEPNLEENSILYLPFVFYPGNEAAGERSFPFKLGETIAERYRLECLMASTNFSTVLECQDLYNKHQVCLKVIHNQKEIFDQGLDEIKMMKLLNENTANLGAKHIVRMREFFYHRSHLFIVYESLGENLFMISSNMETATVLRSSLKRVVRQVLKALAFIHSLNIIHADIKPENILLASPLRKALTKPQDIDVKLVDFGNSCFITDELTTYIQSKAYRAPEVMVGAPYDTKIDIWSLGCVICEILTGDPVFLGETVAESLLRVTAT